MNMCKQSTMTSASEDKANRVAVVVGGSIAGLLAARVLSDHFGSVVVVERTAATAYNEEGSAVPQARHTHALLARGYQIMERFLPGIRDDLLAEGTPTPETAFDSVSLTPLGWTPRVHSGLYTFAASRNLLETVVRRRILELPNVTLLGGYEVTNLLADPERRAVTGITLRQRPQTGGQPGTSEERRADLVVDASGRGSKTPEWLVGLGYPRPRESVVDAFVGYATRWYRWPADAAYDWKILMIQAQAPTVPRGGLAMQMERNQLAVTLLGAARDYPPTDEAGFLEFARTLRDPMIYDVIKDAEPISPIYGYRRTGNRRVHFDKMSRFPENLLIVGDAACGFNPIYGQGMTVAALAAEALDEEMRRQAQKVPAGNLDGLSRRFQKRLAREMDPAWLLATSEDARYPTTVGTRRTAAMRVMQWYMERLQYAMATNPDILQAFIEVVSMVRPPQALFHPTFVMRALPYMRQSGRQMLPLPAFDRQ